MNDSRIVNFQHKGNLNIGFLDIAEVGKSVPFEIKRVFWTHSVLNGQSRGNHAHKKTEQLLIAIKGSISVKTEMPDGTKKFYHLDESFKGVYLPPNVWHTMLYENDAVQLVLCSDLYNENDYLRNYLEFKEYYRLV